MELRTVVIRTEQGSKMLLTTMPQALCYWQGDWCPSDHPRDDIIDEIIGWIHWMASAEVFGTFLVFQSSDGWTDSGFISLLVKCLSLGYIKKPKLTVPVYPVPQSCMSPTTPLSLPHRPGALSVSWWWTVRPSRIFVVDTSILNVWLH